MLLYLATVAAAAVAHGQFTEAPQTVAPGAWLMETDVATSAIDRSDGMKFHSTALGAVLLTTGLTPVWDVQFGIEAWHEDRATGPGVNERTRGTGQAYLRTKWKVWEGENDAALAVLPYVMIRGTAAAAIRPGATEFGVIVPYARNLTNDWSLATMAEWDWLDDGTGQRELWWSGYVAFQRPWNQRVSWYWETATTALKGRGAWATQTGLGVVWQATELFSWDLALYVGVTSAAPDWNPALRCVWSF